jgi:hypothetical protein
MTLGDGAIEKTRSLRRKPRCSTGAAAALATRLAKIKRMPTTEAMAALK